MEEKPADTKALEERQQRTQDELEQCRHALTDRQVALATLEEQIRHLKEQICQHDELSRQALMRPGKRQAGWNRYGSVRRKRGSCCRT